MGRSEVKEEAKGRGTRTEFHTPSLLRSQQTKALKQQGLLGHQQHLVFTSASF